MVATTRIDPRITRTRKLLVDAFMGLLAEKDFEAITVQDIAARATVNRATFYDHFVDKYAMLDELTREGFTQMLHQRTGTRSGSAEDQLRHLFLAVCDYLRLLHSHCEHGALFDSLAEAQIKAQLREQVRAAMLDRSAPRTHSHARLELLTTIISWGIYGAALEWSQRMGGLEAEAFVEEALPLIAASIAAFEDRAHAR
ncbi:MAG TPA: TetR family transcriptional regulator [Roseiflexaceae bacterium]|nr:TetR family transcriptional regulator [Roseiflexaceae bacterium]